MIPLYKVHFMMSPTNRYLLAIVIFTFGLGLRFLILPIDAGYPYLTFLPTLPCCFFLCGIYPGILFTLLSVLAGYYFFIPEYLSFTYNFQGILVVFFYFITATIIGYIVHKMQQYAAHLEQSKLALHVSEQRYLAILEDQTDLICRYNPDGIILYTNQAFCKFFGKTNAALSGKSWHPIAYFKDIALINAKLATLSKHNPVVIIENRVIDGEGNIRWGQFVNRGFFDDKGVLIEIQGVGRDISDRKHFEHKLDILSAAIEQACLSVVIIDLAANIVYSNQKNNSLCGYNSEELIGQHFSFSHWGLTDKNSFTDLWQTLTKTKTWHGELINKNKQGEIYWEDVFISAISNEDNEVRHYIAIKLDISHKKI